MGLNLHCDRCGSFMRNVSTKQLKDLPPEVICLGCKKKEEKLVAFAEGLRTKFTRQMEVLIREARGELKKSLAEISTESTEPSQNS